MSWLTSMPMVLAVGGREGIAGGLHGEFADALEDIGDAVERGFGDVHEGDAVFEVAAHLRFEGNVLSMLKGEGGAGRVVAGAFDAAAGGELLLNAVHPFGDGAKVAHVGGDTGLFAHPHGGYLPASRCG